MSDCVHEWEWLRCRCVECGAPQETAYSWLTVGRDGALGADLKGITAAEMDRRLVILQELDNPFGFGSTAHERDETETNEGAGS